MIPGLKTEPWPHQVTAYRFLDDLLGKEMRGSAGLYADMGTGKTLTVISLLSNPLIHRVLIICPRTVCAVWQKEFRRHAAYNVVMCVLDDSSVKEKTIQAEQTIWTAQNRNALGVVVVNYESSWRPPFSNFITRAGFDVVICDEAHKIRSPGSSVSRFAARLYRHIPCRIALTGTPLAQGPLDAYGLYRFLDSRIMGTSYQRFSNQYADFGGFANKQVIGYKNLDDLHRKMYSIAFRVGKEVLSLPPLITIEREVRLGPKAMLLYRELEEQFFAEIEQGSITISNVLVKGLRLQQCSSGHIVTDQGELVETDRAKVDALIDLLDGIEPDEPVVVFARFRADLKMIRLAADQTNRSYGEVSGKENNLAAWQAGKCNVLGVQIQAGGLGIDLTRTRYVIYYSTTWSLSDFEQSMARAHRGGQTRSVIVYFIVAAGTIEKRIYRLLRERKDVIRGIIDRGGRTVGTEDILTV